MKNKKLSKLVMTDEVSQLMSKKYKKEMWPQVTERISCAIDILEFLQQNKNLPEKFKWRAKKVQEQVERLMDRAWSKY